MDEEGGDDGGEGDNEDPNKDLDKFCFDGRNKITDEEEDGNSVEKEDKTEDNRAVIITEKIPEAVADWYNQCMDKTTKTEKKSCVEADEEEREQEITKDET